MPLNMNRRRFVQGTTALIAGGLPMLSFARSASAGPLTGRLYKTLKIGMVKVPGTLEDKFRAAKEAGFAGIEMNAPGMDIEATRAAVRSTELPVDGTVCSSHWQVRHTSPDAETRATALKTLKQAIQDTHAVGGHSVLLVVGHGQDGPEEEIWGRSIENISQALPTASYYGVSIVVENVWNHFLYDHEGGPDQGPEKFVRYIDEFRSPWVGMQFDIGNHWKYGSMGDWIRALGRRIYKLDLKGFSRKEDRFTKIGEGDLDWADVRKALVEIGYTGWAAAEVGGGDVERLKEISRNMDQVFDLA